MPNPFYSPKRRIKAAKKQIRDLDRRIKGFFDKKPYVNVVEPDSDGIHELHKIRITKSLPDGFTDLTYSIVANLRSALDQSVYAVAVSSGMGRPDKVHFPIADTSTDFENALRGNCKDLPPDILTLLRHFQPYQSGNIVIWALNRIRRQDFHRLIVPVATVASKLQIKQMLGRGSVEIFAPKQRPATWISEENELVFLRLRRGTELNYNVKFMFFIAFGDVEAIAGKPVLRFLNAAAGEVDRIILAIEAESRRIGLIT